MGHVGAITRGQDGDLLHVVGVDDFQRIAPATRITDVDTVVQLRCTAVVSLAVVVDAGRRRAGLHIEAGLAQWAVSSAGDDGRARKNLQQLIRVTRYQRKLLDVLRVERRTQGAVVRQQNLAVGLDRDGLRYAADREYAVRHRIARAGVDHKTLLLGGLESLGFNKNRVGTRQQHREGVGSVLRGDRIELVVGVLVDDRYLRPDHFGLGRVNDSAAQRRGRLRVKAGQSHQSNHCNDEQQAATNSLCHDSSCDHVFLRKK